jgi:hypothetical protein
MTAQDGATVEKRLRRTQLGAAAITQEFGVDARSGGARLSERIAPLDLDGADAIVRVLELSGDEGVTFAALPAGSAPERAAADAAIQGDGWWVVDSAPRRRVILYPLGAAPSRERVLRAALEVLERPR